jgi:hypothetical protein
MIYKNSLICINNHYLLLHEFTMLNNSNNKILKINLLYSIRTVSISIIRFFEKSKVPLTKQIFKK